MRRASKVVLILTAILMAAVLLPSIASAQGTLTGTVRDESSAVLPGVTVEASSPALIEKVRIAVTDGSPRASAVIGTLAVAAVHALLQVGLPARARPVSLLLVGAVATVGCARVAGLGDGILRPVAIAGAAVALLAWLVLGRRPGATT